ncbi:unnamed protein product [Gadus morhua 'NCC']
MADSIQCKSPEAPLVPSLRPFFTLSGPSGPQLQALLPPRAPLGPSLRPFSPLGPLWSPASGPSSPCRAALVPSLRPFTLFRPFSPLGPLWAPASGPSPRRAPLVPSLRPFSPLGPLRGMCLRRWTARGPDRQTAQAPNRWTTEEEAAGGALPETVAHPFRYPARHLNPGLALRERSRQELRLPKVEV